MRNGETWSAERFGDLFARIIKDCDLSLAGLGRQSGLDPSQLSRWRNGKSRPSSDSLAAVYRVLVRQLGRSEELARLFDEAGYERPPVAEPLMQPRAERELARRLTAAIRKAGLQDDDLDLFGQDLPQLVVAWSLEHSNAEPYPDDRLPDEPAFRKLWAIRELPPEDREMLIGIVQYGRRRTDEGDRAAAATEERRRGGEPEPTRRGRTAG